MQPGETVTPGQNSGGAAPAPPAGPSSPPVPPPTAPEAPAPSPDPEPVPSPEPQPIHKDENSISWSASEFMIHQKNAGWYLMLAGATVLLAGLVWLLTQDRVSTVVVGIVGVVFGIAAARQPRTLNYSLSQTGLQMGGKTYPYAEFKSFSVMDEGPIHSIMLLPLHRLRPGVSIYYPPEQEAEIANVLALYLPHEDRQPDVVDRLMHKVRY